jgi:hypothetical protein
MPADRISKDTRIIQALVKYAHDDARAVPVRSGARGIRQWEVYTGTHHIDDYVGSIFHDTKNDIWMANPAHEASSNHHAVQDAVRELMRWAQ